MVKVFVPRGCIDLTHKLESLALKDGAELNCNKATVSHVVRFLDALSCFSVSDSIFKALLSCCKSASAKKTRKSSEYMITYMSKM